MSLPQYYHRFQILSNHQKQSQGAGIFDAVQGESAKRKMGYIFQGDAIGDEMQGESEARKGDAPITIQGDVISELVLGKSEARKGAGLKVLPLRTGTLDDAIAREN